MGEERLTRRFGNSSSAPNSSRALTSRCAGGLALARRPASPALPAHTTGAARTRKAHANRPCHPREMPDLPPARTPSTPDFITSALPTCPVHGTPANALPSPARMIGALTGAGAFAYAGAYELVRRTSYFLHRRLSRGLQTLTSAGLRARVHALPAHYRRQHIHAHLC